MVAKTNESYLLQRSVAHIIDLILLLVLTGVLGGVGTLIAGAVSQASSLVGGVIGFGVAIFATLFYFIYFIYFEGKSGQTPGKSIMSIEVVKEDSSSMDYGAAAIKTVLRIVDQLPFLYLLGIVTIAVTDKHQRIGDMAAGTVVRKA